MPNKHGEFIWYELMTTDSDAAKAFYDHVVGWNIGPRPPGDMDYRMIVAGDTNIGGVLRLTDDMCKGGARPIWMGYVGVDDVDATVSKAEALGGKVQLPAFDIPGVGRIAMIADPQGVPIYVMRPAMNDGTSTAFKPMAVGHCSWNELTTSDQAAGLSFYGQLFGWTSTNAMPMGAVGEYKFLDHHGVMLGAVSPVMKESPHPIWTYYFRVPDIDAAKGKAEACGGKVLHGPMEVPGGDFIIVGTDPQGATFALVGARKT